MKKLGIRYFSMYEIDKYGIAKCVSKALEYVNPKYAGLPHSLTPSSFGNVTLKM